MIGRLKIGSELVAPIVAKTTIGGLREIVHATQQANHIVRFDHVIWLATRMYDLLREIDAIEESYIEAHKTLIADMETMIDKMAGATIESYIEAQKTLIANVEFNRLRKEIAKQEGNLLRWRGAFKSDADVNDDWDDVDE